MLALVTNGFKSFPVSFTSTQAEDVMKRLTEEEWMTCLRLERRHPSHEIYQRSVTAERKHTDQIHHGAVGVFVLLRFFRCAPPPPPVCAIVPYHRGDCQFRFPCVFLTENLLAMNFKGSNMSYVGGSAAPSFSNIPYSATQCL